MADARGGSIVTDAEAFEYLRGLAQSALDLKPEQIAKIRLEDSLVESLQLDSLKQVVLMSSLEESFGFELSPNDLDRIQQMETIGELVSFVRERAALNPTWK